MTRYPEGLPRPQRDDYEITQTNKIQRTSMASGRAVQRIIWDDVPSTLSMSFVFNHLQSRLFDAWVNQVVKGDWFLMPIYDVLGYDDIRVCRFTASPEKQTPVGVTHWRYACIIEIQEKPEFPEGWAEVLPDYVLYPDVFDIAMNKLWPLNKWQTYIETTDLAINKDWPTP